ncbi:MAG TPA: Ca2+-dependent phosphoinositide-specific phospholipase C, partial [Myxococcota bacterium]|nr:Ca2+-dependent phosphoinositide-specific phospholipase C [Myxococcota bacterium]
HGGNENNCGGGNRSFDACLDDLRAWHDAHPDHPLVLVFVDKKQGWGGSRMPRDFDVLLAQHLDGRMGGCADAAAPSLLVTPAALRASARTLRQAAERQMLPNVAALRGKFLFVLTAQDLSAYVEAQQAQACALVAPEIYHHQVQSNVVHGTPPAFSTRTQEWVIFYNINYSQLSGYVGAPYHAAWAMGDEIRRWHYLSRVYAVPGTVADYRSARADAPYPDVATTDDGNNVIVVEDFEQVVGALSPELTPEAHMAGEAPNRTAAAPAP